MSEQDIRVFAVQQANCLSPVDSEALLKAAAEIAAFVRDLEASADKPA